ncbi:MAG: hypothetical protein Q7S21_00930 [archaeon]|nr:hypothetical protein [archaeon]
MKQRKSHKEIVYTKKQLMEIDKLFKELAEFGKLKNVQEYRKSVEARIKA